jgi:hypothetical protein
MIERLQFKSLRSMKAKQREVSQTVKKRPTELTFEEKKYEEHLSH